jgi:hypothetical protein
LTKGPEPDDSTLIRYLVGRASEEETEQLDELSTVDEDFAQRLRAVEHDLVDAYANGALTGDTLEGFRLQYLRSPAGLLQVEFAEALRGYPHAAAAGQAPTSGALARLWTVPAWRLAAAVVLAALGYLLVDDLRVRRQLSGAREAHAEIEQRARQLQEAVNRQQATTRATEEELARAREALAAARANDLPRSGGQGLLALALLAATRSGADIPQLAIPRGAEAVVLRLPLVAVEFAQYEAALRDTTGAGVVWRSGRLPAPPAGDRPVLPVPVPTSLLTPRVYTLELTGISPRGDAAPLDTYPFKVVP